MCVRGGGERVRLLGVEGGGEGGEDVSGCGLTFLCWRRASGRRMCWSGGGAEGITSHYITLHQHVCATQFRVNLTNFHYDVSKY